LPKKARIEVTHGPVNRQIRAGEVRLVGIEGGQTQIMRLDAALKLAKSKKLDLLQVSREGVVPAVVKMLDLSKFLFDTKKKIKKDKNSSKSKLKTIQIRSKTSDHDLGTKVNRVKEFTAKGWQVKIVVLDARLKAPLPIPKKGEKGPPSPEQLRGKNTLEKVANLLEGIAMTDRSLFIKHNYAIFTPEKEKKDGKEKKKWKGEKRGKEN